MFKIQIFYLINSGIGLMQVTRKQFTSNTEISNSSTVIYVSLLCISEFVCRLGWKNIGYSYNLTELLIADKSIFMYSIIYIQRGITLTHTFNHITIHLISSYDQ